MKTIAHHSCNINGGIKHVEINSPFFAEHKVEEEKYQFLGSGYYFWDNNLELAKKWGEFHYNNKYYIFEFKFDIKVDTCLDLVGNREHQFFFKKMFDIYEKETGDNKEDWSICQCIEFFKTLRKKNSKIFPFKMIRAVDLLNHTKYKQQFQMKFVKTKKNYTIINPKMVICVMSEQDVPQAKKLVFTSVI